METLKIVQYISKRFKGSINSVKTIPAILKHFVSVLCER